jgi:hypothetical protein
LQKVLIDQFGPDAGMNVVAAVVGGWALLAYFFTLWSARRFGSGGPLALINDPDGIRPLYTGATGNARFWSRPTYQTRLLPVRPRRPSPPSQATAEADITASDAQTQTRAR